MRFEEHVTIPATPERVWAVYSDITHWPEWTDSMTSVEFLDAATSLAPGVRARIRQPKLPAAVWEVTTIEAGRTWTWVAKAPGMLTTAVHTLVPLDGDAATRVDTEIVQEGFLGSLLARPYAGLTRRYLAMEAAGLSRRCVDGNG